MSLIMEALKKAQQIRSQESKGIPFFKQANGKGVQGPTGRKYGASLLIAGLGILLFISFGGSALLPRLPSQAEQKMASAYEKKPVLPPANIREIHEPYPEEIPRQKIKPSDQPTKNPSTFLWAQMTPRTSSTSTSAQALVDPGIEKPFPLMPPLIGKEKEEPSKERTAEKGNDKKVMENRAEEYGKTREALPLEEKGKMVGVKGLTSTTKRLRKHSTTEELKMDGEEEFAAPPAASPKEAVPSPNSLEIAQVNGKEHSAGREVLTHFNRGVHFSQQGDFARAAQAYEKVIELEPSYAEAYNNLAIVYQEMGDREKARFAYQKSIELKPGYEKAHNNLGILLYLQGRYEESTEAFQKALAINPHNMESYINLGILYKKKGQMEKAIACYQKALDINPLNPEAHYNIALLCEHLGNWVPAISHYQEFVKLSAENHSDLVSRVKRHLDDLSRAIREMNRGKGPGNG